MDTQHRKISRQAIKEALLRSGYLLETRVESLLREQWGYVETNASYQDPLTGKSRELDVYAMSVQKAGPKGTDFIFAVLLIECVNNPHPLALLTKDPLVPFLHHHEIKLAGLPVKMNNDNRWERLTDFLGMEKYHHYCRGRVATQYCSFLPKKSGKNEEWMATHEGSHFDSFQKLCDVVDYFGDRHFKSWKFDDDEPVNIEFYYPVLVLQGDLLEAIPSKRSVLLRAADHLQFRRSSIVSGKPLEYQIDVLRERFLPKYINMVQQEIEKTARLLRRRHRIIRASIEKIVQEARALTTPEQIRPAMDYE
jgi:hypothetical protein